MRAPALARLLLALTVAAPVATLVAAPAPAEAKAKKAKGHKRAKHAPKASADRIEKISAKTIARWHKRGDSQDDIVARAREAGWTATKRDARSLKRAKVPATLIAELRPAVPEVAAAPAPKAKVDLTKPANPTEIDFDSVPPPPGSPGWVQKKTSSAPAPTQAAATRTVESPRQPAPSFAPAASPPQEASAPTRRRPIVAKDS